VYPFSAFPVSLIGSEVDSPLCQNSLLHDPCSLVELSLFNIVLKIIHMGADTDLVTCGVLNTDVLGISACVSGEESCVRINSRCCGDCTIGRGEDVLHTTRFALPIIRVPLDDAQ
jgi:hypothetical protein